MENNTKKFWESKTMWFSIAIGLIGILEAVQQSLSESGETGIIITGIAVVNMILRSVTNKGIK